MPDKTPDLTPGPAARKVTSFDVAAEAGVSQPTVSRALSGSASVTMETRDRVEAAARKLGYVANRQAAQLRRGRSSTLAVVVISESGEPERINPFTQTLLSSICSAAAARGYDTLVSLQASADELDANYVPSGRADGLIVIGSKLNRRAWAYFDEIAETRPQPVVMWGTATAGRLTVGSENREGARLAVRHLVEQGRSSIVCITSSEASHPHFEERVAGYLAAMRECGLEPQVFECPPGGERFAQGSGAAASLCAGGPVIDGIFAVCDALALGVLDGLRLAGVEVPGQVGVVGFDGLAAGRYCQPGLTTIAPDYVRAGELLVDCALNPARAKGWSAVPVSLVARQSTAIVPL